MFFQGKSPSWNDKEILINTQLAVSEQPASTPALYVCMGLLQSWVRCVAIFLCFCQTQCRGRIFAEVVFMACDIE